MDSIPRMEKGAEMNCIKTRKRLLRKLKKSQSEKRNLQFTVYVLEDWVRRLMSREEDLEREVCALKGEEYQEEQK